MATPFGLFDSDYEYTFESVAAKLTDQYPHDIRDAIMMATARDQDIPAHMLIAIMRGFNTKVRRFRSWAERNHERGLPEGSPVYPPVPFIYAEEAITATTEISKAIVISKARIEYASLNYIAFQYLQTNYNWNHTENILTIGSDQYSVVGIRDDSYSETYTYWSTDYDGNMFKKEGTRTVAAKNIDIFLGPPGAPSDTSPVRPPPIFVIPHHISIPMPRHRLYVNVTYEYTDSALAPGPRYYSYPSEDVNDPAFPKLDYFMDPENAESYYYPIIPLRIDRKFINENEDMKKRFHYESSKKLLDKIDIDIDDLLDAVQYQNPDAEEGEKKEEVENLEDVNDVFFQFALDLYTEEEASAEYFYRFFNGIRDTPFANAVSRDEYYNWLGMFRAFGREITASNLNNGNSYSISESEFSATMYFNYMSSTMHSGNVWDSDLRNGEEWIAEECKGRTWVKIVRYVPETRVYAEAVDNSHNDDGITPPRELIDIIENSYVLIRRQTAPGKYSEVRVAGINTKVRVEGYGKTRTVSKKIERIYIHPRKNANGESSMGSSALYFPLNEYYLKKLSSTNETHALLDAMMITVNAVHEEEIKWYQKGIFKALLQIAALAIAVWGIISGNFWATLMAMSWIQIIVVVVIMIALPYLVKYLVEELGTLGMILAVIITIAATVAMQGMMGVNGLPFAQQALMAVNAIIDVVNVYVEVGMEALNQEFDDFLKDTEEAEEELTAAKDLLNQDDYRLNPLYITGQLTVMPFEETPTQFFDRVAHTGNPGVVTLDAIHDYCSEALKLPVPDYMGQAPQLA